MVGASLMEEQWQQDLMDFAVEPVLFVAESVLYFLPAASNLILTDGRSEVKMRAAPVPSLAELMPLN